MTEAITSKFLRRRSSRHVHHRSFLGAVFGLLLAASPGAWAQTVVQVETNLGEFFLQLFDDVAPQTVANFINYVITDRYDDSIVHRSEPGFVIQGGQLKIEEGSTTIDFLRVGPTIENEFSVSNTRGTIAMARVGGQVNSATSQWFINLGDNSGLDTVDEGFTVFGQVLGNGMEVVDAIAALQRVQISGLSFPLPVINFDGSNLLRENLVIMDMNVVSGSFTPPNVLNDEGSGVSIKVNGGNDGIAQLTLDILSTSPEVVVQVRTDSIVPLAKVEAGFSVFSSQLGQLFIPELSVNGSIAYKNLLFTLSDAAQLKFTLTSAE